MVSLKHLEYLSSIEANWKTRFFNNFILEKPINLNGLDSSIDIEDNYIRFVTAVSKKEKAEFLNIYSEFSKRRPSVESPWLHDNFLIFTIMVGVVKFDIGIDWLNQCIKLRENNNKVITQINTTFKNILLNNYSSKDNLFEIVYMFQELINIPISPVEEMNNLYNTIASDYSLLDIRDDFLKLLRLRVIDIIVLKKELPNTFEITAHKNFRTVFLRRIDIISKILYVMLLISIIIGIYIYQSKSKANQDLINIINTILGILGAGLLIAVKWMSKLVEKIILIALGYNKIFNDKTPRH